MDQYVPAGLNGKRPPYIVPPAIDPLSPKNMALSPEDAAFVCDQFGIDVDRPLICQVSRFDPWKDPIGVIDAYRDRHGGDARGAARADRLDGDRRPRGLGLLQLDDGARAGRPRHQDPQQPEQRRRDRGERVPVAGRRRDPEVDPRGLRPDRLRGALEGAAVHRRRRRRDPAPGRRRRDGLPRLLARGVRGARARVPEGPRARPRGSAGPARSTCARTSSRRACCATGCVSSETCHDPRTPARPRLEPRPRDLRARRGRRAAARAAAAAAWSPR